MTFKEAYKYAKENSEEFNRIDSQIKADAKQGVQSACLQFQIDGEVFYYGFDGVDWHRGKQTPKRAEYLIRKEETLIIL